MRTSEPPERSPSGGWRYVYRQHDVPQPEYWGEVDA